jgi:hypothetical protein
MAWGRCVEAEGAPTYWPWRQVLRSLRIDSDTVLDVVSARLDRVSAGCRRLVQAAAIVGRDFSLVLVAATLDEPVAPAARCGSSLCGSRRRMPIGSLPGSSGRCWPGACPEPAGAPGVVGIVVRSYAASRSP